MKPKLRTFDSTASALAFPLGGVGTGNVSLGARGDLRDWEIFNRSAKGTVLPNTFFAVRAQAEGGKPVVRVLEGPIPPPYTPSHGFDPSTGAGLPRFTTSEFCGEYPLASIRFEDDELPLEAELEAFTPLIPLNPEDSGIPAAVFSYRLRNAADKPVSITLVGSITNPVGHWLFDPTGKKRDKQIGHSVNRLRDTGSVRGLHLTADGIEPGALEYGSVSLVTDHANITAKPQWLRGGWWDYLREFWDDLESDGLLTDLGYDTAHNYPESGSLGMLDTIPAGEERVYRFVLAWHFPNRVNTWGEAAATAPHIRNHYATRFTDSWDAAEYLVRELPRLESDTRKFHAALFGSTLPAAVLDRVSANIVPARSNTCFWLEDGRFFGWEGCFDDGGCCHGSCTHVWSYAYTIAYLWPSLEREMRRIELNVETEPDGYMAFRTVKTFPLDSPWLIRDEKVAAVDGQMGTILRAYREWLLCGDKAWLGRMWGSIKDALNYVNIQWDQDNDGVLEGRQHNTYDIEFYGANPLCTFYYLAALKAVAALAEAMGEAEIARRCAEAFERGSARADALMWNGAFYVQDLADINAHPYQFGRGCLSDSLLGALHARALGLGDVAPSGHLRGAIKAVYDRNFRRSFARHVNAQRSFVLNDERGLVLCSWDEGVERPRFPFPYSDEVWTGIEYHVAAHLIYEGWLAEGLEMVEAVNDRHDGTRRSPWNEVECGHHYARSMSSWLVLLALSGFHADRNAGILRFDPVQAASTEADGFQSFWSNGTAWGTFTRRGGESRVEVMGGTLDGVRVFVGDEEVQRQM